MPRNANQSKSTNYSLDFIPTDVINVSGFSTALSNVNNGTRSSDNNLPFSWSVWFKSRNSSNSQGEIAGYGQAGRNGIRIHNNVFRSNYTSDLAGTTTIIQDKWYHGVVTYDGTTRKIYINGVFDNASDTPASAAISNQPLTIGVYPGGTSSFNGELNELCFFDYALSASQVTTLYGNSTNGVGNPMALPSSPIAYYPLGTSAWNGQYLAENNAIGDYVFDFESGNTNFIKAFNVPVTTFTECTISAWVKFESVTGATQYIVGIGTGGAGKFMSITKNNNSGTWYSYNGASSNQTATSPVAGVWYHAVVTQTGTTRRIYIDGVEDANSPFTVAALAIPYNNLTLGGYNNTSNANPSVLYRLDGLLSNVQVFNTALSGLEVTTLYNYGSPIQTLASIPQSSNLKAWYKLDASEIYNSSTTEWEVNNALSPWTSSLSFDSANNDKVDCGTISQTNEGDISFSVWCNLTTTGGYFSVLSSTDSATRAGILIIIDNNGKIKFERNQNISGTRNNTGYNVDFSFGSWNHLCGTFDSASGVLKAYVNGVLQNTSNDTSNSASVAGNLTIGALVGNTGYSANGSISNVQIFNTALPAAGSNSVETLYNNGSPLTDMSSFTSLLNWYKLDNSTTGIEDSKGSNNGTNYGATEIYGSVSTLNGTSSGMSQANLVQSDLQTVAPYSKYALDFDGSNDYINLNSTIDLGTTNTISFWHKRGNTTSNQHVLGSPDGTMKYIIYFTSGYIYVRPDGSTQFITAYLANTPYPFVPYKNTTDWANYIVTRNGDNIKLYLNGVEFALSGSGSGMAATTINTIANKGVSVSNTIDGELSNVSMWNTSLTPAQVTEIYNEGLPGNLNSHSAYSNLVSWWQLGENSSFDGNDWICADEKGSNNGTSVSMPVSALVNGVGTTANGVSSGMSEGNLVGDAPYSTANALSTNMAVTARVTGSGNTP